MSGEAIPKERKRSNLELALEASIDSNDPFVVIVKGHQALGKVLTIAISDALAEPHALEIGKLAFPLKVDLAAALRAIPSDCRPGYMKLNSLRNRFAHDPDVEFREVDARAAYDSLSEAVLRAFGRNSDSTEEPLALVKRCIFILHAILEIRVTSTRDNAVEMAALMDLAEETHRRVNPGQSDEELDNDQISQGINARIKSRVEEERTKRQKEGDL